MEEDLVNTFFETISAAEINRIARQTGFVKINSPLDGAKFLKLLLKNSESHKNINLNLMRLNVRNEKAMPLS